MVESNSVTVTCSEVPPPPTAKYKCPFCDLTFDTLEELLKHLFDKHPWEIVGIIIAIIVLLILLGYGIKKARK